VRASAQSRLLPFGFITLGFFDASVNAELFLESKRMNNVFIANVGTMDAEQVEGDDAC
jgi:hypothetical protein